MIYSSALIDLFSHSSISTSVTSSSPLSQSHNTILLTKSLYLYTSYITFSLSHMIIIFLPLYAITVWCFGFNLTLISSPLNHGFTINSHNPFYSHYVHKQPSQPCFSLPRYYHCIPLIHNYSIKALLNAYWGV